MLAIEMRCRDGRDEKLGAVGVGAGVGHAIGDFSIVLFDRGWRGMDKELVEVGVSKVLGGAYERR